MAGHGYHGKVGGFEIEDLDGKPGVFSEALGELFCEKNSGCRLNACFVAYGFKGKNFICAFSKKIGVNVKAWDDWYAVVPHGMEFTACKDGTWTETGDTGKRFKGSWIQWFHNGCKNPVNKAVVGEKGKTNTSGGIAGIGGKEDGWKQNTKGCRGLKDGSKE